MKKLFILLALLVVQFTLYAQEPDAAIYNDYGLKGVNAFEHGDYKSAIVWLTKAADYIKPHLENFKADYADLLNLIGYAYSRMGNFPKAIELYQQALLIQKEVLGETHPRYALSLNILANAYLDIGNYSKSIELNQQAKEIKKEVLGESHPGYAASLNNLAEIYRAIGNYTESIELNQQAKEIIKEALGENHPYYATSLSNLGVVYCEIGNYSKAIELSQQALKIKKEVLGEHHPDYAVSLNNLAGAYSDMGDYPKAIELSQQALKIKKEVLGEMNPDYAVSLNNLANAYSEMGDYTKAIELHKQILVIRKKTLGEFHPDYAASLSNLAEAYLVIGSYSKSIELNQQAKEIIKEVLGESHPNYAVSLNNLANAYSEMGSYPQAIELYKQGLEIIKEVLGETNPQYAALLSNLANAYSKMDNYPSIELYKQILAIRKKTLGETHPDYAASLSNLGAAYSEIGNYPKAIEFGQQALAIRKEVLGETHPDYATSLSNLGVAYSEIGNYPKAIELNEHALAIIKEVLGEIHPDYVTLLNVLILYNSELNKFNKIPHLWKRGFVGLKQWGLAQLREMTSLERQTFWDEKISWSLIGLNSLFVQRLSKYKRCKELSYNLLLFTKGAMLATNVDFNRVILESGDMELLAKFEELRATRKILNTYYNKPIAERPKEEVERLEVLAGNLEKDLIAGSKEYADFTHRLTIEWKEVRDALERKDVAIEFLAADKHNEDTTPHYYAALVLRKGWNAPKYVDLCSAEELNAHISGNNLGMIYQQQTQMLYNLFWGKLEPYLKEGDNVYFSPDGALHQMNIEVLQDADGRRANEKWNLYRVSSTRELCVEKENIKHRSAVLYGGLTYDVDSVTMLAQSRAYTTTDDLIASRGFVMDSTMRAGWRELPGTKEEVDAIAKMCKSNQIHTDIYTTFAGNEESFKALSGKRTPIIHLATHGFFYKNEEIKRKPFFELQMDGALQAHKPNNSLKRSGLILAGAQKAWLGESIPDNVEDGILLAEEIAAMDLRGTDLVVLSACETGLGEITSEGVFGLQRAFKMAGVQTIVMSLWQVHDDATSLFMQTFYENLFSGRSKRDAFELTQKTMQQHPDYSDPYYWASFIMLD